MQTVELNFSHLLKAAGLDLKSVRLVRHTSVFDGLMIRDLWLNDRAAFEHF